LSFREVHGAERVSINAGRRLAGFRRTRRFFRPLELFLGFMPGLTRLFVARLVFPPVAALRFLRPRTALRVLLMAGRLDAAQGAAKLFDLALIGEFLALGDFHEFKDFVQLINRVFQGFGNFRGVRHGLTDGRGLGRAEIGRLDPGLRLRAAKFGLGWTIRSPRPFRQGRAVHLCRRLRRGFGWGLGG
jgi:hypothetical protein